MRDDHGFHQLLSINIQALVDAMEFGRSSARIATRTHH